MVTGAWLPDPTRADRLRYWDGLRWTEHVSESGAVQADPIVGAPPPPPAPPPAPTVPRAAAASPAAGTPAPAQGPPATGGVYPPTVLGRAGFVVAPPAAS